MKKTLLIIAALYCNFLHSQNPCYWQQKADYKIEVDLDVKSHRVNGSETIIYKNNSADTLDKLFFHLYFNAFQPNSMMDLQSRNILDPDMRIGDRLIKLNQDEMGFIHVKECKLNGKKQKNLDEQGTILEIKLSDMILPGEEANISLEFEAQVPIQIRRSGRNNAEGIDYSMAQWYPKLAEYDYKGWDATPYIAREFYGVWGDFEVTINMDSKYVVAATGVLQNPDEIGYGYADKDPVTRPKKHKWVFKAENVHDFVWAADPDYKHTKQMTADGVELNFFYKETKENKESWENLPGILAEAWTFINAKYGKYPYPVYSFIQGGDGGMEYPMATLITGNRALGSLVGVCVHELMHSWYQCLLGTNESLYPWMDEGFTSFASTNVMDYLRRKRLVGGKQSSFIYKETMDGFANFAKSGYEEPMNTPSDHYSTNAAYSVGSYTKGELALVQLNYILGEKTFSKALLRYFNEWKFKHPTPDDFFRVFEKESGLDLDWFQWYWTNSTRKIDYAIDTIVKNNLILSNVGQFPMPLDVVVTLTNGKKHMYYIPQSIMRGKKEQEMSFDKYSISEAWDWTNPIYSLKLEEKISEISRIDIDPSYRLMDVNRDNNTWKAASFE